LNYISINNYNADFGQFEIFFKGIHSQIEVLRFETFETMHYVDANKWKQLISHHIHHLEKFYFQCSVTINDIFKGEKVDPESAFLP